MSATLVRVSLRSASGHTLPGIRCDKWYLARVMGQWVVGQFSREWYGLHFDCDWGTSGIQFDAPGENGSTWEELYEIRRRR